MMRTPLIALVLLLSLPMTAHAEGPVYFADARLKSAVEEALWITNPTPTDMLGLTELRCINHGSSDAGITVLTGLECAVNLQSLNIRSNQVSDVSPLAGLTGLQTLSLCRNRLSSVSPLSGLTNLTYLDVHGNVLTSISPLASLSKLKTLICRMNSISDISPMSGLSELQTLDLCQNQIGSVSPLSGLSNLRDLNLMNNEITDISPLAGLTSLLSLDLRGNPWSQEACDVYIPQIAANNPGISIRHSYGPFNVSISSGPGGCVSSPYEGQSIYGYQDLVWLVAEPAPGFVFTHWSGTLYSTENPYYLTVKSAHQIVANFAWTSSVLEVDGVAANDPQADGTSDHPFGSIQEAIEAATDGATIIVRLGVYREQVDFLGKKIHLVAADPANPWGGPCATIDGMDGGTVVTIPSGSGEECSLSGFVITRGRGQRAGGIYCAGSSPTISHCLVVGNRCTDANGAAVYLSDSQAVLMNCTIADNYGGANGAGLTLVDSNSVVANSILWGNAPYEIACCDMSVISIRYSCVEGGWLDVGTLEADPLFVRRGSWVSRTDPDAVRLPVDPQSVWLEGDYRLRSQTGRWDVMAGGWVVDAVTSPCIDAGDPEGSVGHEPEPNGGRMNMGAYGGTNEASKS